MMPNRPLANAASTRTQSAANSGRAANTAPARAPLNVTGHGTPAASNHANMRAATVANAVRGAQTSPANEIRVNSATSGRGVADNSNSALRGQLKAR